MGGSSFHCVLIVLARGKRLERSTFSLINYTHYYLLVEKDLKEAHFLLSIIHTIICMWKILKGSIVSPSFNNSHGHLYEDKHFKEKQFLY